MDVQEYISYMVQDVENAANKVDNGGWMRMTLASYIMREFSVTAEYVYTQIDKWVDAQLCKV